MRGIIYTDVERAEGEPSLGLILRQAQEFKADRVSLVCEPNDNRPAGICVVMLGKEAIRDMSPYLLSIAQQIGETKPQERLAITLTDSARHIFQWLVENEIPWTYGTCEWAGYPVMVFTIVGTEVCQSMEKPLNDMNCPTSLR